MPSEGEYDEYDVKSLDEYNKRREDFEDDWLEEIEDEGEIICDRCGLPNAIPVDESDDPEMLCYICLNNSDESEGE